MVDAAQLVEAEEVLPRGGTERPLEPVLGDSLRRACGESDLRTGVDEAAEEAPEVGARGSRVPGAGEPIYCVLRFVRRAGAVG